MADENDQSAIHGVDTDEQEAGSGAYSLAGYDYQVDVSIWLALDLVLNSGLTQMVELEPGTEEDIEAQLADEEPGRVATRVELPNYTLVVQAKLRGGDAWTVNGFNRLLKHGSETRLSAAQRLTSSSTRYLLVTSAALNGGTRGLRVKRAGSWPKKSEIPASTANLLGVDASGRVAIIGNLDEERLVGEIKRLLIERFGIPNSRWIECLRALREEAHLRIRRVGEGLWHREDLAAIVRKHDGYLASSPQLDEYVHPKNWQELRNAMGMPKYAAIIVGQSGTGKTLATSKLYAELRLEHPGLTRVRIRNGPHQLRDDQTPPPVLYDIEDPWGRYDFNSTSRPWNDELAQWLSRARADRMVIATTRRDVAVASGGLKSVEPWVVPLEAEHYGKPERQQIYRSRINTLPRDVQLLAIDAEEQVLGKLATPLELEKFFDALRTVGHPQKNREHAFITDAIAKAHEQTIELTVTQQIEERDDVSAAAVIWGFLKANDHLSLSMLRSLEQTLAELLPAFGKGITPLIDFLVAARNLRCGTGDVTYYHPRVEAGIEGALKRNTVPTCTALRTLLDVLTDLDGPEGNWGSGVAARIVAAAKNIPDLVLVPKQKAATKIDAWLSNHLADPTSNFNEQVRLAAKAGSPDSNAAEFARFILHRPNNDFGGFHLWQRPERPEEWYKRLRTDPSITDIAKRFIREMLPDDRDIYSVTLVHDLDRLASDMTPVYLETAAKMLRYGSFNSSDIIAVGALRDLDGFEPIIDDAIKELTPSSEELTEMHKTHLAIVNKVYNDDYAEHLEYNDDHYTATEFLQAYTDQIRHIKGWNALSQHRHAAYLLTYWMRSFMNDSKKSPPLSDEMAGSFAAAFGTEEEDAIWFVLMQHWDKQYQEKLLSRICDGSPYNRVRHAAVGCLVEQAPELLESVIDMLRQAGRFEQIVELMIDLAYLQDCRKDDGDKHEAAVIAVMDHLEPALSELCEAARNSENSDPHPLSSDAVDLLNKPSGSCPSVRTLRIRRHVDLPSSPRADIEWTLAYSDDHDACKMAIDVAISLNIKDIVTEALNHKFAHVVAKALTALGEDASIPLPENLLAFAEANGSPVRKSLVDLLAAKPHVDHLPALLRLAQDTWSSSSRFYGEDDIFPIARSAVNAIASLTPLDSAILQRLQEIALATSDYQVSTDLFRILVAQGGTAFQKQLFELAVGPGRVRVGNAAARAMLLEADHLSSLVLSQITINHLETCRPSIVVILTLITASRASLTGLLELAREISANPTRRALVLLMLWPAVARSESTKTSIEELLPKNHPSLAWVNAGPTERVEDSFIADLGDPAICGEVLRLLNPTKKKS